MTNLDQRHFTSKYIGMIHAVVVVNLDAKLVP